MYCGAGRNKGASIIDGGVVEIWLREALNVGEEASTTYTNGSLTETTKTLPAFFSAGWLM
jgi:hypothetical protein